MTLDELAEVKKFQFLVEQMVIAGEQDDRRKYAEYSTKVKLAMQGFEDAACRHLWHRVAGVLHRCPTCGSRRIIG